LLVITYATPPPVYARFAPPGVARHATPDGCLPPFILLSDIIVDDRRHYAMPPYAPGYYFAVYVPMRCLMARAMKMLAARGALLLLMSSAARVRCLCRFCFFFFFFFTMLLCRHIQHARHAQET